MTENAAGQRLLAGFTWDHETGVVVANESWQPEVGSSLHDDGRTVMVVMVDYLHKDVGLQLWGDVDQRRVTFDEFFSLWERSSP